MQYVSNYLINLFFDSLSIIHLSVVIVNSSFWPYFKGAPGRQGPMGFPGVTVGAHYRYIFAA